MIIYKCDVCEKSAPAPTAAWEMRTCPPLGWFTRRGLTTARHEVAVVVCSKACGDQYDRAEVEQVGLSWTKVIVSTDDGNFKGVFPLKAETALDVACPKCGARAGVRCSGGAKRPHLKRRHAHTGT